MKDLSELEMERTAFHEAGHAVASVHLGVPFDYVEVVPDGTGGVYLPEKCGLTCSELKVLAQKQIIVAYAGPVAQRLFFPDQPEQEIKQCSQHDIEKIDAIATDFPDIQIGKQAESSAQTIVEGFRDVIRNTAEMLLDGRKLTFDDVRNLYTASRPQASLRSGDHNQ